MQRVGWSVWKQAKKSLDPARGCTFVANGISLQSWPRASSNSTWVCRPFSSSSDGQFCNLNSLIFSSLSLSVSLFWVPSLSFLSWFLTGTVALQIVVFISFRSWVLAGTVAVVTAERFSSCLSAYVFFSSGDFAGEPPKDDDGKPPRPKKLRRRARYGTYDKSFEDELDMVPLEEGITHLYNARGIVDKWLGHPTLDAIFPGPPSSPRLTARCSFLALWHQFAKINCCQHSFLC